MAQSDLPKISRTDSISLGKWKPTLNINHSGQLYSARTRVTLYLEESCAFNNGLKILNQQNESLRSQHSNFV